MTCINYETPHYVILFVLILRARIIELVPSAPLFSLLLICVLFLRVKVVLLKTNNNNNNNNNNNKNNNNNNGSSLFIHVLRCRASGQL
jgi:hypothetical protein